MQIQEKEKRPLSTKLTNLIAIGVSTGGPQALTEVLSKLPPNLPAGIIIVQHMLSSVFTASLCKNLSRHCTFHIVESKENEELVDGKIIIANGDYHTEVVKRNNRYFTTLNDRPPVTRHKPSVDVLLYSIARLNKPVPLYITILTGIGDDGTLGCTMLKEKQQCTILTESEETCVVYGMPKQVYIRGLSDYHLPLQGVIPRLTTLINHS